MAGTIHRDGALHCTINTTGVGMLNSKLKPSPNSLLVRRHELCRRWVGTLQSKLKELFARVL